MQKTDSKRQYAAPRLQVYGDIRELTANVGNKAKADGGSGVLRKTST